MPLQEKISLRFFDLVMLVVSLVIGLGIFSTPSMVALKAGNEETFFLVWIVGGVMALCGALVYAELGTMLPESGAYYKIFAKAYHPSIGFAINILIFICNAASLGIVALIGAEYCMDLFSLPETNTWFPVVFSAFCLTLFLFVNLGGLRSSSRLLNVLLLIKIALMLVLISTLFHEETTTSLVFKENSDVRSFSLLHDPKALLACFIPVCFSYGGYQQTINFGSEVRSVSYLRKGIVLGMLMVIALYLLLNMAYVHTLKFSELQHAKAIGATLFSVWFGDFGAKLFDALVVCSVLAYTNVLLMSNPLVMQAMAHDKLLPAAFAYQHPRTGARITGLIAFYLIAMSIVVLGKQVESIMGFTMFLDSIGMIASAGCLFFIRKKWLKEGGDVRAIRKLTPFLAVVFILFYILVAQGVMLNDVKAALLGAVLFMSTWIVWYLLYKGKQGVKP